MTKQHGKVLFITNVATFTMKNKLGTQKKWVKQACDQRRKHHDLMERRHFYMCQHAYTHMEHQKQHTTHP
jgi:hypothetical protein